MSVTIKLGAPYREITGGVGELKADGTNLVDLFARLEERYPGFRKVVFDDGDKLKEHAHLFVNGEDYRLLGGITAPIKDGDVVSVLFALDGG